MGITNNLWVDTHINITCLLVILLYFIFHKKKRMDKSIAMTTSPFSFHENGNVLTNNTRGVPLHLTLTYDDKERTKVVKQEILRQISSTHPSIDSDTGEASLQF